MTLEKFLTEFYDDKKLTIKVKNGKQLKFPKTDGNELIKDNNLTPHLGKSVKHLISTKEELSIIVGGWDD